MAERQSARMSKIKNGRLDQYGAEPFEQQRFGTPGVEGVKTSVKYTEKYIELTNRSSRHYSQVVFARSIVEAHDRN